MDQQERKQLLGSGRPSAPPGPGSNKFYIVIFNISYMYINYLFIWL